MPNGALRGMERDLEEQFERLVHEMERIKFVTRGRSEMSPPQDCYLLVKLTIDEIDRERSRPSNQHATFLGRLVAPGEYG